ncbi:cell wall hydrolase [Lachnobacterium bovis]|uniref:Cell Wall Hydrolase n=1 Tax=Lachnobacterium bovis TaxID=140626 RepID=A0A1H9RN67_9FIRM|nr:cell wall hydrolase [Lachnobacterium bovis]SER74371.1 Cell Wall Hydrolase [Lachnobacterium bovis]
MKKKLVISTLVLSIIFSCNCYTARINAAGVGSISKDELIKQKKASDQKASELAQQKDLHKQKLNDVNSQMGQVSDSIQKTNDNISKVQKEIRDTQEKIKKAKKEANERYEEMKYRIKYIYENSSANTLSELLYSKSMAEFLNKMQFTADVYNFDKKAIVEYQKKLEQIDEYQKKLKNNQAELKKKQDDLKKQEATLNESIKTQRDNLQNAQNAYNNQLNQSNALDKKIKELEAYEKKLEEERAKAVARAQQQQKNNIPQNVPSYSGVATNVSASEEFLLGAIIQCEAGGEPYEGKLAVGSVILNRVHSPKFPNSLTGVIYQSGQFTPARSGRLAMVLQSGRVDASCMQAAREVLSGKITINCLYFCMNYGNIRGTVIGKQVFYNL